MLYDWSITKKWCVSLSPSASTGASRKKGRAMARERRIMMRMRRSSRRMFSICMRFWVFCSARRRNSIAAQRIRLNFWRCRRWMMTGIAPPSANQSRAGLKNPMLRQLGPDREPAGEVLGELDVQVLVRRDPDVDDHLPDAALAHVLAELIDLGEVGLAEGAGVDELLGIVFEALEEGHALEGEGQLVLVEDVEDDHVVALVAEVLEALQDDVGLVEEVGDQDDQPAALDALGQGVQHRPQ